MASNKFTPNLNLSQFDGTDKPTWRGDYNNDMLKIDTGHAALDKKHTDVEAGLTQGLQTEQANRIQADKDVDNKHTAAETSLRADLGRETANRTQADHDLDVKHAQALTQAQNDTNNRMKIESERPDILSTLRLGKWTSATTRYISHRGGTGYPEQSIEGCKYAQSLGFIPEVDVRLLKDGTPVLCHDETIGRTMSSLRAQNANIAVREIPDINEWKNEYRLKPTINGGLSCPSPTLWDLLANCANRGLLNIEVKELDQATLDATIQLINIFHAKKSVILASFDHELMRQAKAQGFTTMCFAGNDGQLDNILQSPAHPDFIGVHYSICTIDRVNRIKAYGSQCTAWTCDLFDDVNHCRDAGAVLITSNRPDIMTDYSGIYDTSNHNGKIMADGVLQAYRPYDSININRGFDFNQLLGPLVMGDMFGHNYGQKDGLTYMVWEPYKTRCLRLNDNEDSINVHVEGYCGPLVQPTASVHETFAKFVIFDAIGDGHFLDDASCKFAMFSIRRAGEANAFARNHQSSQQASNSASQWMVQDNGQPYSEQTPFYSTNSRISYTLDLHFHKTNVSFDLNTKDKDLYGALEYPNGVNMGGGVKKLAILMDASHSIEYMRLNVSNITTDALGTGRPS